MTLLARTTLFLALTLATLLLAIFIIKAAIAFAFIVAAVFAVAYLLNFFRALARRIAARGSVPMLRR